MSTPINKVKKGFGNKLFKLGKMRKSVKKDVCIEVYKTMVMPTVEYCTFYTGSGHVAELQKL